MLITLSCFGCYFIHDYFIRVEFLRLPLDTEFITVNQFASSLLSHSSTLPSVPPTKQKCMRFNPDATVWVAKQRILCTLNQSLKDVLNYGLFQPASNGRDGKFLDEERILREYPQPISKGVPALEVKHQPGRLFSWKCIKDLICVDAENKYVDSQVNLLLSYTRMRNVFISYIRYKFMCMLSLLHVVLSTPRHLFDNLSY